MNRLVAKIVFLLNIVLVSRCAIPLFPLTGKPLSAPRGPDQLVRQLVESYENQNLFLFEELFDQRRYKFYVNRDIINELQRIDSSNKDSISDTLLWQFGISGLYSFIGFAQERSIHRNMFQKAQNISFIVEPALIELVFIDTLIDWQTRAQVDTIVCDSTTQLCDTLYLADSVQVAIKDTLGAVGRTGDAQLAIEAPEVLGANPLEVDLGEQVFVFEKDEQQQWKIISWFDIDG